VGIVAVSGCSSQDKPVVSRLPIKAEQLSVYRGFLDKFSSLHFRNLAIRTVPLDMTCHFLRVSSLREGSPGAARTDIVFTTEIAYEDRHILLLDDIIDTGITLNFLLDHIRERRPRSLKVAALIDKPADRKIEVQVDWAAFTLKEPAGERFLVGYGLDYAERYRGLPYIGTIPRPEKPGEGRTISIASGS
jgi:hypoxanthine phosphoribosyltransferase